MTRAQWLVIVVIAIFGLAVLTAGGAYLVYQSQLESAPALVTSVPAPQATQAVTPFRYPTLPPEWTATLIPTITDTPLSSATATASDTALPPETTRPSATPIPPTHTPRPTSRPVTQAPAATAGQQLLYQLNGNGTGNTQVVVIQNGLVQVDWNYAGSSTGGTLSAADENYHIERLDALKSSYDSDMAFYKQQEDDAARRGDALEFSKLQGQANARTTQYNNDVAAENSRYQAEKAGAAAGPDNTTFDLWGSASDGSGKWFMDGTTGPGHGVSDFAAAGGVHFIFEVKASGPWSLSIYWQSN